MRIGVACLVLPLACASGKRAAPVTAAEAAREAAQQPHGGAGDAAAAAPAAEESPCQGDGDCALTHVEAGACCPMLCAPPVVTTIPAQELKAKSPRCGPPPPPPPCLPPPPPTLPPPPP